MPEFDVCREWAKQRGLNLESEEDICKSKELKEAVLEDLRSMMKPNGLVGFECVDNIYLDQEPFSTENGVLTATLKLRRNEAKLKYLAVIKELYGGAILQGENSHT